MQMKKRPKQEDFFTRDKEEAATDIGQSRMRIVCLPLAGYPRLFLGIFAIFGYWPERENNR